MRKVVFASAMVASQLFAASFVASFGDGGLKHYEVIDNVCYGYAFTIKDKKQMAKVINKAIPVSIARAKKTYGQEAKGFINIRSGMMEMEGTIFYQVCGDVVK